MVKLDEYIGKFILLAPALPFDRSQPPASTHIERNMHMVRLEGVEVGGIWIDFEPFSKGLKRSLERAGLPLSSHGIERLAVFLPYSQIGYLATPLTELDPTTLGLPGEG